MGQRLFNILFLVIISTALFIPDICSSENKHNPPNQSITKGKKPSIDMLNSIIELRNILAKRIDEKKVRIAQSTSQTEKENLSLELEKLDKHLQETSHDFERVATGIDTGLFSDKKEETFDWKNEIVSLIKPGINEIKRLTLKTRKKSKLKDEIYNFEEKIPYAEQAISNISQLIEQTKNKSIRTQLYQLLDEWKGIKSQLENKVKVAKLKLQQMGREKKSIVEASQDSVKNFFKSKGLFILIAIAVSIAIIFLLRLIHNIVIKFVPGFEQEKKPFQIKAFELFFRILTLVITLFSIIFVFYSAQDWTLLSLTIIFLLGLGWTLKNTIPKLWLQSRLMLNIGPVREGERIIYQGIPWMVSDINFYTTIENPTLQMKLRLPIEDLVGMISRPVVKNEPWFPCKKNDWVILADETRGKVVSISNEMVELVMRGGAHKTYQTQDFLALSPMNISTNFRLKVTFGLSYDLQTDITQQIPSIITEYIKKQLEEEGYTKSLLNLNTEFEQAGGSSLDLVVIADFKGQLAAIYNRLKRRIQKWCVEASTLNNWEIPFPQLTVHKSSE